MVNVDRNTRENGSTATTWDVSGPDPSSDTVGTDNGDMDSMQTWPQPRPSDRRDFDLAVARQLRSPGTDDDREAGAPPGPGEKLRTSMLLVIPLVVLGLGVLAVWWNRQQGSSWWIWAVPLLVVLGALLWLRTASTALTSARSRIAARLPGVVGHGVAVVREVEAGTDAQEGVVPVTLRVKVTPVRGAAFESDLRALYAVEDLDRLVVGSHGVVRYLHSDPAGSVAPDPSLDENAVQQVYRAAAL